jgi:hypothetical protein
VSSAVIASMLLTINLSVDTDSASALLLSISFGQVSGILEKDQRHGPSPIGDEAKERKAPFLQTG